MSFSNILLSRVVSDWYASHAVVRRLWVIKQARGVRVVLALEPPVDGDDTHPAWLANSHAWAQDLRSQVKDSLQLELMEEPAPAEIEFDGRGAIVMELSWRDPSY